MPEKGGEYGPRREEVNVETAGIIAEIEEMARQDAALRKRILDTETAERPLAAFCDIARELGYELYEMDIIAAGEEFHAAMKRSTNGGGENTPALAGQDDYYAMLLAVLKNA